MRKYLIAFPLLAIASALASAYLQAQEPVALRLIEDADSYAVYAFLVPQEWPVETAHAKRVVLNAETTTYEGCFPSFEGADNPEWRVVMDAYRRENATKRLLMPGRTIGVPYIVVPAAEIKTAFVYNPEEPRILGWDRFYLRYPDSGGVVHASVIGFDSAKRRAMVYMGHSCNLMCGGGTYHFLEKVSGAWRRANVAGLRNCGWAS